MRKGDGFMENKEGFHYSYSSERQEEIKRIREKYPPGREEPMERLRRLDAGVSRPCAAIALMLGIFGTLLLGVGLCCVTVWAEKWFFFGIFIGLSGIVLLCLAYPCYRRLVARRRKKLAPEILRLTDELLK